MPVRAENEPWDPPEELLEIIADRKLHQRDRVELVIAFYAADHGGTPPTYDEIAAVIGIHRQNAYRFAMELLQTPHPRAVRRNGKFWLIDSRYSHPIIKKRFSALLQEP